MSFSDLSVEPSTTRNLTSEQKERLTFLLEKYLTGMEEGVPPTVEQLAADEPELRQPLQEYIAGLQDLHRIAVGFDPNVLGTDSELGDAESSQWNHGEQQLGDFRLREVIGRGGMGVVYRADQLSLGRTVAIKLLPVGSLLDQRQIARFRNEAQAAACLQHPNIVPVYAVGCQRGVHYYAMQFIDGCAMDEVIAENASEGLTPDWRKMVELGIQASEALHWAHESSVIHRDIKPSNLLLDREGKLWVTDFGLARYQTDVSLTQSGDIVGTMRYMSPEQARGESALVDGRTDVYSLGVTLFEMLSLHPAHDAEDAPSVLRLIDQDSVPLLRQHRGDIPRDLETVIAKAMSPSRDRRYETALEFADDLRSVLAGLPTVARPPTWLDRSAQWASKHQRSVATSVLLGIVALFGLGIGFMMIAAEKQKSDTSALRAQREKELSRAAVDHLGSRMAELLADIPAAESVRRQLLDETLTYYQSFVAFADRDPQLREDMAITYGKIGMLQSELGELPEAISALQESERIYSQLAQQNAGDSQLVSDWSVSQNNLAETLQRSGDLQQSAKWFARAIKNQERLLGRAEDTSDVLFVTAGGVNRQEFASQCRLRLAASLNNLGLLLADSDAGKEAEAAYLRAISLLDSGVIDGEARSVQLARVHANLSGLLVDTDVSRAVDYARQALGPQVQSLQENPGSAERATSVIATLNTLGALLAKQGNRAEAVRTLRRAIEIGEHLQQRWPDQSKYRADLVISLNQMGLLQAADGNLDDARAAFQQASVHQRALASAFQDNPDVQSMMGGVLNNLGFVQQKLGDRRAAESSYREAVKHQQAATRLAPDVARYRDYLDKHQHNLDEIKG